MRVTIPALVPFRYPLLVDWIWIYIRHHQKSNKPLQPKVCDYYWNRLMSAIILEIPDLPDQLIQSLEEVGCYVER